MNVRFRKGDQVRVTLDFERQFPTLKGRLGFVTATPRPGKAIPTIGVRFDGSRSTRYLHADFLRHADVPMSQQEKAQRVEAAITLAVRAAPQEAQPLIIALLERAFQDDSTEIDNGLASGLVEGIFVVTGVNADGELLFRLTERGHEQAKTSLMESAEMREFWNALGGPQIQDEPKVKQ